MTKEMIMEILKKDRCTTKEAEAFLKRGTVVYEEDELQCFIDEYNANAYDEDDMISKEGIEANEYADITCVTYEGSKYYIAYVN